MSTIKYLDSNGLIYLCKKIKSELSGISLTPGPKGDKGNGFYVMSENDIEYLIECLNINQINYEGQPVNRDNLVIVLSQEAQNLGGQISQNMSYGLYEYFSGDDYNYYLIDGYLLGNVLCEYNGEPVSYVSSYEFVKIRPEYIKYEAGDNIDISNSIISAKGYTWDAEKNSFAVGKDINTASDNYSFAEGFETIAYGVASHAEGCRTEANGDYSHAEGYKTQANNIDSHAEGNSTIAYGFASHAEGCRTEANGESSHAEGEDAKAYGNASHAEGCGYYEPKTQEIVIKKFVNDDYLSNVYDYTGINFNYFTDSDIGNILNGSELYAPSDTGLENAIGEIAVAKYIEGYGDDMPTSMYLKIYFYNNDFDTLPDQDDGKLVLVLSRAGSYGEYSHSEGDYTNAQGYSSHAEGSLTIAKGYATHAEGEETLAYGEDSHTEGFYSISYGGYSHSEGYFNTSSGDASHAEGSTNIALGEASHAEGIENKTYGDYSHAEGQSTTTRGQASHAEGQSTTALGYASHAEGIYTFAYGDYSHAEGSCTNAGEMGSHAEGYKTQANSIDSHAEGNSTIAYGFASHTEGECTITYNNGEHAEGRYNVSNYDSTGRTDYVTISSIGIGSDDDNRANAVEVMQNGDMYVYGVGDYDGTNPSSADTIQSVLSDLTNNTAGYITEIPVASHKVLGCIKVGENLRIDDMDGKLYARGYTWDIESSTMTVHGQINAPLGFYETSDARKKNIIDELPLDKAYELINNCQSIIYTLKDSTDKQQIGLIAQEVQQYFPEVVSEDKDGYLSLDYAKLTAIIFRVLKDVIDRLSKLENK